MKKRNKETETADKCKLPQYLPDICERCRCYRYCHRQLSFEDLNNEEGSK